MPAKFVLLLIVAVSMAGCASDNSVSADGANAPSAQASTPIYVPHIGPHHSETDPNDGSPQ